MGKEVEIKNPGSKPWDPELERCGAVRRQGGEPCGLRAGWGTDHLGVGRCKLHGGSVPIKSGRYSKVKNTRLKELIAEHEADPDPLNMEPELAAMRALFEDFINRYEEFKDAILAWHASFSDEYLQEIGAIQARRGQDLRELAGLAERLTEEEGGFDLTEQLHDAYSLGYATGQSRIPDPLHYQKKPRFLLDISDAHRILTDATRIVQRIMRGRAENAISRADFYRVMHEFARVAETYVQDERIMEKIRDGWLSIRVA